MLARYKTQIVQVTTKLRKLEEDPRNHSILTDLQHDLVKRIRRVERSIARLRENSREATAELRGGRRPKTESAILRKIIARFQKDIEQYQYLKFIWKCFGDGIAFIYLDKYGLKHAYYDTTDYVAKQDAGALSGKKGFAKEWAIVRTFNKKRVPAMLCDITNILRHGDVCVLIGPDPIPIEVKSSRHTNRRVERQHQSIAALTAFLETDEARDFRGIPHVTREELPIPEVDHMDALNKCIGDSAGKLIAAATPEKGLRYLCIRDSAGLADETLWETVGGIVCVLNEAKREQGWAPYYPFTLSIGNPLHLYEFIRGDFTLAVAVDCAEMTRQFSEQAVDVRMYSQGPWEVWMRCKGSQGVSGVSRQFFGRLFYEFQSLSWFVAVNSEHARQIDASLEKQRESMAPETAMPEKGWFGELPDWALSLFDESDAADAKSRPP